MKQHGGASQGLAHTSTTLSVIEHLKEFLDQLINRFLLPIATIESILECAVAWQKATSAANKSPFDFVDALVKTLIASGWVTGTVIANTALAAVSPFIITGVEGANALLKLVKEIYYLVKFSKEKNHESRNEYKEKLKENSITLLASLLILATMILILSGEKLSFALLGIAGGSISAAYIGYKVVNRIRKQNKENIKLSNDVELLMLEDVDNSEKDSLELQKTINNDLTETASTMKIKTSNKKELRLLDDIELLEAPEANSTQKVLKILGELEKDFSKELSSVKLVVKDELPDGEKKISPSAKKRNLKAIENLLRKKIMPEINKMAEDEQTRLDQQIRLHA